MDKLITATGHSEEEITKVLTIIVNGYYAETGALKDVAAQEYMQAVQLGITDVTKPQSVATREQVATMIMRAYDELHARKADK